jgi:hypothetical protein
MVSERQSCYWADCTVARWTLTDPVYAGSNGQTYPVVMHVCGRHLNAAMGILCLPGRNAVRVTPAPR